MAKFHHIGVPVDTSQGEEIYIEAGKVFITDPASHPYNIEYLRFEQGSPMHQDVQDKVHVAFMVEDIEAALADAEVIIPPFDATEELRVAFIKDNGAVIELMQTI